MRMGIKFVACGGMSLICLCLAGFTVAAQSNPTRYTRTFTGSIGRYPIRMTLHRNGNALSGTYTYLNNRVTLNVKGTITASRMSGSFPGSGDIELYEYDGKGRRSGRFEGQFTTPTMVRGSWWKTERPKNRLSLYLEDPRSRGPFAGGWTYNNKGYTFSLDLTQRGNRLEGSYCAVTANATRVDCLSPVTGRVNGSTAQVKWTSAYGGVSGGATLTKRGSSLLWKIVKSPQGGSYYAPMTATLRK